MLPLIFRRHFLKKPCKINNYTIADNCQCLSKEGLKIIKIKTLPRQTPPNTLIRYSQRGAQKVTFDVEKTFLTNANFTIKSGEGQKVLFLRIKTFLVFIYFPEPIFCFGEHRLKFRCRQNLLMLMIGPSCSMQATGRR